MLYSSSVNGFFEPSINKVIPADAVEISSDLYIELMAGIGQGFLITADSKGLPQLSKKTYTSFDFILAERCWRNSELTRADIELNKVQDSDPKAKGTVSQWRDYRKALRAWPEHENFPNLESRPVSPDA